MTGFTDAIPYTPAPGFEDRPLDAIPPPHTAEQIDAMAAARPAEEPMKGGMINYVSAEKRVIFVPQWKNPEIQGSGWYNAIYVQTYFHHACGPRNWIRQWVHHVDGVFVMPYRETKPPGNPVLKWTNRERNDFESEPLGMANVKHHGIHFVPMDGNLNRELYFWTQVFEGDTWLRAEDRPVRWPK